MLSFYYESNGPFPIKKELNRNGIHFFLDDIMTAINTLSKDGYIEDIAPGHSKIPVCTITGNGRIFYEEGGYRDDTTKFDKIIKWAKNNKYYAWAIFIFIITVAIIGLGVSLISIFEFFQKQ